MQALQRRVIDQALIEEETVTEIISKLKSQLRAEPLKDADSTIKIKKHKGEVEAHGLMADNISTIDRIELAHRSSILGTKTTKITNVISVFGHCDLHYVEEGIHLIHKLAPGKSKRLESKTSFSLSSNGVRCRVFLITEEL